MFPVSPSLQGSANPKSLWFATVKLCSLLFIAGMELQKELEVLDGLKAGDSVVTSGQTELLNGSAVLVIGLKKGPATP